MIKYSQYLVKKRDILPIHLILEVTSACNAKCITCFNWQKTDYKTEKRLSLEHLEKVSRSLKGLLWFSLTGGEPFLRDDLVELIKIFIKNNNPEHITIPTNCLLPDKIHDTCKDILEVYKKNLVITLSLDGIGDLHDKIRGVKGNFEKFLETYKQLKELKKEYPKLHIGVNTVIINLNQDKIKEIFSYVKDNLDVESHSFEIMRGCSRDKKAKPPSLGFYKKNKEFFKDAMKSYSYYKFSPASVLLRAAKLYYHDISYEIMKQKKQLIPCYAGNISAVIDVQGNVYPCELYKKMGNLNDFDFNFKDLWFSENAKKVKEEIKNKCCYCSHSCFQFVNILFNPKLYPRLARHIF